MARRARARTHVATGTGVVAVQTYEAGEDAAAPAELLYTVAEWEHDRGVEVAYVGSVSGVRAMAVPVSQEDETLTLTWQETPLRLNAAAMQGQEVVEGEDPNLRVLYLARFDVAGGLKPEADLRAALAALVIRGDAKPGVYELTFAQQAAPVLRRLSPLPEVVDVGALTTSAVANATYLIASPPQGAGGSVMFALVYASTGRSETEHRVMKAPLHRIVCLSDFSLGSTFEYLIAEGAVPDGAERARTRGGLTSTSQTFSLLGGAVRTGQVDFATGAEFTVDSVGTFTGAPAAMQAGEWLATGLTIPSDEWGLINLGGQQATLVESSGWYWMRWPDLAALDAETAGSPRDLASALFTIEQRHFSNTDIQYFLGRTATDEILATTFESTYGYYPLTVRTVRDVESAFERSATINWSSSADENKMRDTGMKLPDVDGFFLLNTGAAGDVGTGAAKDLEWVWIWRPDFDALTPSAAGDAPSRANSLKLGVRGDVTPFYSLGRSAAGNLMVATNDEALNLQPLAMRTLPDGAPATPIVGSIELTGLTGNFTATGIDIPASEFMLVHPGAPSATAPRAAKWNWLRAADLRAQTASTAGQTTSSATRTIARELISWGTDNWALATGRTASNKLLVAVNRIPASTSTPSPDLRPLTVRAVEGRIGRALSGPAALIGGLL